MFRQKMKLVVYSSIYLYIYISHMLLGHLLIKTS